MTRTGDTRYMASFRHHKTGIHVISQNWKQYRELRDNDDYSWGTELGEARIPRMNSEHCSKSYHLNESVNKFWKGAEGLQKVGYIKCSGIFATGIYDYIRIFLLNVSNHAAMQGDAETYQKAQLHDKAFHHDCQASILLLPPH